MFWYLKTFKHSLSGFNDAQDKKLKNLIIAQKSGLNVPKTFITSRTPIIKKRALEHPLITKGIHMQVMFSINGNKIMDYTNRVDINDVYSNNNLISPSLFQNEISKRIELRVFFLGQDLYPMAIFSQENKKTEVDFRHYDNDRPNRNVPFSLPDEIRQKIRNFIRLSNLNTGSIDMILTTRNKYIFLEVNPVGQFGMVSFPCNYFLEREVAEFLTK